MKNTYLSYTGWVHSVVAEMNEGLLTLLFSTPALQTGIRFVLTPPAANISTLAGWQVTKTLSTKQAACESRWLLFTRPGLVVIGKCEPKKPTTNPKCSRVYFSTSWKTNSPSQWCGAVSVNKGRDEGWCLYIINKIKMCGHAYMLKADVRRMNVWSDSWKWKKSDWWQMQYPKQDGSIAKFSITMP